MSEGNYTLSGSALSGLILELFRLNNRLLATGDRLVAELGLTSARWNVLGTIIAVDRPQPVAWLARDMGGNRQNVQRIVNDLANDGLVEFQPNPHHRKAQLVVLTTMGRQAFDNAMRLQAPWINELSEGLRVNDIETAHYIMTSLCKRLEGDWEMEEPN